MHNIDLTGHQVPWEAIGQLDALEELSLWNCGLAGPIEAGALCGLRDLRVLAVSQNALYGTVPECVAELSLQWLWLDANRVHGPISEFSSLGQFLKNVDSRNLAQNRWAPLLRTEKAALRPQRSRWGSWQWSQPGVSTTGISTTATSGVG